MVRLGVLALLGPALLAPRRLLRRASRPSSLHPGAPTRLPPSVPRQAQVGRGGRRRGRGVGEGRGRPGSGRGPPGRRVRSGGLKLNPPADQGGGRDAARGRVGTFSPRVDNRRSHRSSRLTRLRTPRAVLPRPEPPLSSPPPSKCDFLGPTSPHWSNSLRTPLVSSQTYPTSLIFIQPRRRSIASHSSFDPEGFSLLTIYGLQPLPSYPWVDTVINLRKYGTFPREVYMCVDLIPHTQFPVRPVKEEHYLSAY